MCYCNYYYYNYCILYNTDGTANNLKDNRPNKASGNNITNVLKLHLLAGGSLDNTRNDVPGQVCLYERGIGGTTMSRLVRNLRKLTGRLQLQTRPMRKKLEEVYETGDEIYIVGFSRGAGAARNFACQLNERGLRNRDRNRDCEDGSDQQTTPVPIQFLGCFDTISMQYWRNLFCIRRTQRKNEITKSSVLGETDGKIPPNVAKAVHHVSLDDARFRRGPPVPFPPVFMDSNQTTVVHEAYFPGDHGGVGGNHYEDGMSDVSCRAMQEWLEEETLAFLTPETIDERSLVMTDGRGNQISLPAKDVAIDPDPTTKIDYMDGYGDNLKKPSYRPVVTVTNEKRILEGKGRSIVKIHVSALQHYEAMDRNRTPYAINPNIKKANIVIVDNLQHEMKAETKKFKEILEM